MILLVYPIGHLASEDSCKRKAERLNFAVEGNVAGFIGLSGAICEMMKTDGLLPRLGSGTVRLVSVANCFHGG